MSAGMRMMGWVQSLNRPLIRRVVPAGAFFGGFFWDALTIGRVIYAIDLLILLAYYMGAGVILLLIGREIRFRFSDRLDLVLQFLFGGIFSALVIFYFLSSGELRGFLVVLLLTALLVGNEFLESRYSRLTLSWTLFALCGIMFLNFALPHLFRTISTVWFYLSTLVAVLLLVAIRWFSTIRGSMIPALITAGALLVLHSLNAIPPVPLVSKEMLISHSVQRIGGDYRLEIEPAEPWKFWRSSSITIHRRDGEAISCFTSVFVPRGIETMLVHHWERLDTSTGRWITTDRLGFPIAGGREQGYRGTTRKRNLAPGSWRVRAESEKGATVGLVRFDVEPAAGTVRTRIIRR